MSNKQKKKGDTKLLLFKKKSLSAAQTIENLALRVEIPSGLTFIEGKVRGSYKPRPILRQENSSTVYWSDITIPPRKSRTFVLSFQVEDICKNGVVSINATFYQYDGSPTPFPDEGYCQRPLNLSVRNKSKGCLCSDDNFFICVCGRWHTLIL